MITDFKSQYKQYTIDMRHKAIKQTLRDGHTSFPIFITPMMLYYL